MPDGPANLALAADFPSATRADWEKLALGALKGRPLETLTSKTHGRVSIAPLYERAAGATPVAARTPAAPWQILQRVDNPDPAAANAQALEDLENGATGLVLTFRGSAGDYGFGLEPSALALARVLEGVYLDAAPIEFDVGALHLDDIAALVDVLSVAGVSPTDALLRVSLDAFSHAARSGCAVDDIASIVQAALNLHDRGFAKHLVVANARVVHAAGGSEAHELGFALAAAVGYLRAFEREGLQLEQARRLVFFRLAADADQFLTITKLRAIRKLWARVEESCGLTPEPAFVSIETAWRMMTRRDPHGNLLRTTVAAFAAAVGGADAITVLPYTAAIGLPDAAARRLARNAQTILVEESNLAKVGDPGAGSGAIEDITAKLCAGAWEFFQKIEEAGGLAAALASGFVQNEVAMVRAARERAVATRRDALTGTSEFPNLLEVSPTVLAPAPKARTATKKNALARIRLSRPFEALRDTSDDVLASTGQRPRIFLATLGNPADYMARATFVRSLFESGGIEVTQPNSARAPHDVLAEFRKSGARLVCLCGKDESYAEEGADAAAAFRKLGAVQIYIATRPSETLAKLKAIGAEFVFTGCDAIATLQAAYAKLQAKRAS
ncbi:MAG: methylmalonyl-CoA mutase [Variibacter sp.]|nr:methylmalonyl-CoA mutase [Variibacter sp.]